MKTILLAAGAVAVALTAGSALAAPRKTSAAAMGPSQPIPYSQLNAYAKASPKQRASRDWSAGATGATTGAAADTAASSTAGADTSTPPSAAPSGAPTTSSTLPPANSGSMPNANSPPGATDPATPPGAVNPGASPEGGAAPAAGPPQR
jgi:hypothetical protein